MRQWQEWNLMHLILKVLNESYSWLLIRVHLLLWLFVLKSVLDFPKPCHIIVREHDSLGICSSTTCIKKVAANAGFLFNHLLNYYSVVDVFTQLQKLSPIVNIYPSLISLTFLVCSPSFSAEFLPKLRKYDSCSNPKLKQLLLINKILQFKSWPIITHDHFSSWMLNLQQTGFWWIC